LRLAKASSITINLDQAQLQVLGDGLRPAAELLRMDPMAWVLNGGEDHGLLATFPVHVQLPPGFTAIGSVQALRSNESPSVKIADRPADAGGWDHFAH
jgi:thiamine-monophosphate kinase